MNRGVNDPVANQQRFEEVKSKQNTGAATGGGWLSKIGGGFSGLGFGAQSDKEAKNYTTCLTYM